MICSVRKLGIATASIGVAGAAVLMLGAGQDSQPAPQEEAQQQAQEQAQQEAQQTSSLVATYDPQAIFEQSERSTQLQEKMAEIQSQMQQAQQQGNRQKLMQLQQQIQQTQRTEIDQFMAAVDEALPAIAKEAGFKIVAVQYEYVDESLGKPADLTDELIEQID